MLGEKHGLDKATQDFDRPSLRGIMLEEKNIVPEIKPEIPLGHATGCPEVNVFQSSKRFPLSTNGKIIDEDIQNVLSPIRFR